MKMGLRSENTFVLVSMKVAEEGNSVYYVLSMILVLKYNGSF